MSKKWLVFFLGSILCLSVTACGGSDGDNGGEELPTSCESDEDCEGEDVCNDSNECVAPSDDEACTSDEDCEDGNVCLQPDDGENSCVACTEDGDCDGDRVCSDDNTCVNEQADECNSEADCGDGETCSDAGTCVPDDSQSGQCQSVGNECDPNQPAGDGFVCANTGLGPQCFTACSSQGGSCPSGASCVQGQDGSSFCQPSQCNGPADTESCQEYVENDSERYPNGAMCVGVQGGINVCHPAGDGEAGSSCDPLTSLDSPGPCQEGLRCIDGTCTKLCEGDGDCSGDADTCVGEEGSGGLGQNTGFCSADACTPFQHGESECGDGEACQPVSSNEGTCTEAGDTGLYQSCQFQECSSDSDCPTDVSCNIPSGSSTGTCDFGNQCSAGARCLQLFGGGARCYPSCDPTNSDPNSTCPSNDVIGNSNSGGGRCLDLAQGQQQVSSSPGSGVCVEQCQGPSAYGENWCTSDSDVCQPFQGDHLCTPSEQIERGSECDPTATGTQCAEGSYCQARGDGTGVCEPYCFTGDTQNETLTCGDAQSCQNLPNGSGPGYQDFGECQYNCSPSGELPDGAEDTSCPENLQSCLPGNPDSSGEQTSNYCFASADVAQGESCGGDVDTGSALQQNCAPGNLCSEPSYNTSQLSALQAVIGGNSLLNSSGSDATCRPACDPFPSDGESDCGDGSACGLKGQNTDFGVCLAEDSNASASATTTQCSNIGEMCGDASVCVSGQLLGAPNPVCLEMCENNPDGETLGCSGNATCEGQLAGSRQNPQFLGKLGICIPQQ